MNFRESLPFEVPNEANGVAFPYTPEVFEHLAFYGYEGEYKSYRLNCCVIWDFEHMDGGPYWSSGLYCDEHHGTVQYTDRYYIATPQEVELMLSSAKHIEALMVMEKLKESK